MGYFTFIPVWVIQDVLVVAVGVVTLFYIFKYEKYPRNIIFEMICFILLNAAVYENFATLMGWYGYGRSLFMIGNVPLSVPLVEYLVVYATLKMLSYTKIPAWCKPFIVGFSGMVFDFTLDPVATKMIYQTKEALIGRWTWYPGPGDVTIYGEPVYNFTGWVLLCGFAAATILLGRWWFEKSNRKPSVGIAYPVLSMIAALLLIVSPLSQFLLWLAPFFSKGSVAEWIMLGAQFVIPIAILAVIWRGRMNGKFTFRENIPVFIILIGFHLVDLFCTLIYGYWDILWLELLFTGIHGLLIFLVWFSGRNIHSDNKSLS